jgi:DNA invertase Pin-like site-specific DNA recombinase
MTGRKQFSQTDLKHLAETYESGINAGLRPDEIAERFGIKRRTLYDWLKRCGINTKNKHENRTPVKSCPTCRRPFEKRFV